MMLFAYIVSLIAFGVSSTYAVSYTSNTTYACDSYIYCHGELLHTIQMLEVFNDSKTFVDMKLKLTPYETNKSFMNMMQDVWKHKPTIDQLTHFTDQYFENVSSEYENWTPTDWTKNPTFIDNIRDINLKNWSIEINDIWKNLGRKIKDDVRLNPHLYSLIYLPYPIIVPGGRFREVYYWDSYWIIRGLLICQMNITAKGMISNYLSMIETFGLIPNGGRIYYVKRSQPPMLIPMMKMYVDATNDIEFMKQNIHILEKELTYWTNNHSVIIKKNNRDYKLAVYKDSSTGPRPESYREDINKSQTFETASEKENFYSELKAAAESGWDFSSRWFILNGTNQGNIINVKTREIIPVDLNSLVYWGAAILKDFYRDINVTAKVEIYENIAQQWKDAVTAVLWDEDIGSWLDYDMINNKKRNYFYPTNISPLWTGCFDKNNTDYIVSKVIDYLNKDDVLKNDGGIPTTLRNSEEQWDKPNAWPPLQYIFVMALDNTGNKKAQALASNIAHKWMCSNYAAYKNESVMYEKYRVDKPGEKGVSSGEYIMQEGFGWTNGIILEFLQKYNSTVSIETWKTVAPICYEVLQNITISKGKKSSSVPN